MKKQPRYTKESANLILKQKKLDHFLSVVAMNGNGLKNQGVTLLDKAYGEYNVDLKSLSPKTRMPLHKKRRHENKMNEARSKLIGTTINGCKIIDLFYGPDEGYKNTSIYLRFEGKCGHVCIGTKAYITKHAKSLTCFSCSKDELVHGERTRVDGVLKKRTPTYTHWVNHKSKLPEEFQDFTYFKKVLGDKPSKKAKVVEVDGRFQWDDVVITLDPDLNLIATAIRQAFRHSELYKQCLKNSQVETEDGTRYRCASCNLLFIRNKVQVDHIEPINPLDGSLLKKEGLIDRIFTNNIQVLDKTCHTRKSTEENRLRRENKKLAKNKPKV